MSHVKKLPIKALILSDSVIQGHRRYALAWKAMKSFEKVFDVKFEYPVELGPWSQPTGKEIGRIHRKITKSHVRKKNVRKVLRNAIRFSKISVQDLVDAQKTEQDPDYLLALENGFAHFFNANLKQNAPERFDLIVAFTENKVLHLPRKLILPNEGMALKRRGIIIDPNSDDTKLTKQVLHELGHIFGASSSSEEFSIMNEKNLLKHSKICWLSSERNAIREHLQKYQKSMVDIKE